MSTAKTSITPHDAAEIARNLEGEPPEEILRFVVETFGATNVTLACSFQAEDIVLVDMISRISEEVRVFSLDTGFLFSETEKTQKVVESRYNLPFETIRPGHTIMEQASQYGRQLYLRDPDLCCKLNKVQPLERALQGYACWITGIRREQSPTRANAPVFGYDEAFGLYKANPIVTWNSEQVWEYVRAHNLPYNPLHDRGYPSIGCAPCTRPVAKGEDPRAGRWSGFAKTECGLHAR
ncbi:MAG: phosphoadenylyl-sulfate reductase [Acidimicrobiia bacterium]